MLADDGVGDAAVGAAAELGVAVGRVHLEHAGAWKEEEEERRKGMVKTGTFKKIDKQKALLAGFCSKITIVRKTLPNVANLSHCFNFHSDKKRRKRDYVELEQLADREITFRPAREEK